MATRNRYAEIMAQYAQSQPFSFFGYPQAYTGGFTGYPSDYTGGFTPYTPQAAAPVTRYEEIMAQPAMGGGGNRGKPVDYNPEWSGLTSAERAAYYRENPTEGEIALTMQDYFGTNPFGALSKYTKPDAWYNYRLEKQGYDPEQFAYGPPDPNFSSQGSAAARNEAMQAAIAAANAEGGGFTANPMSSDPAQQAAAIRQAEADSAAARASEAAAEQGGFTANPMSSDPQQQAAAIRQAEADSAAIRAGEGAAPSDGGAPPSGGGGGGGYGGGGDGAAGRGEPGGDRGGWGRGGGYAKGGHVSMQRLLGPNPEGPDDGYASLKDGEYVINDKAVKKYGIELMNAINSGKISKGKLRGLLEM